MHMQIESISKSIENAMVEEDRVAFREQRAILLAEGRILVKSLEDLSNHQQSKRHCSSFTVTVPGEQVTEVVLWKAEVIDKNVLREVVDTDHILVPSRPLMAELRWLQLKTAARRINLDGVKKMRVERDRAAGKRDLEVPYHPLLLQFYQAASRGQIGLDFLAEDHTLPKPREDIRGFINDARKVPQECKSECVYNPGPELRSVQSIDANAEAFGKLLQVGEQSSDTVGEEEVDLYVTD